MKKSNFLLFFVLAIIMAYSGEISAQDQKTWYVFNPANNHNQPGKIGMNDWNNEPAGAHGRIQRKDDKLIYNGKELKLWGLNNCYGNCFPSKEMAQKCATFYRKFGINSVRLHKYADGYNGMGIQTENSFAQFDADALNRMDYYINTLKESGIYTELSPTFGVKIGPGDLNRIPFHSELGNLEGNKGKRIRAPYGMIYLSTELQDMQIEQTTKILKHTNPYSGLRYADDPAIFCVELFNEDAVLWYGADRSLKMSPTIRVRIAQNFSQWLLKKYGNEQNWKEKWGKMTIYTNAENAKGTPVESLISQKGLIGDVQPESISQGTVIPWGNCWLYDNVLDPKSVNITLKQRMFDTMEFLNELQNTFYARFVSAIRETGFKGEIVGSNWIAGSLVSHLLNLHSDYQVGIVDRHNYFGGDINGFKNKKPFSDGSMLARPGIGLLSSGFQQASDRPFMLSEWIHVQPNEWYAEGPAIMGAYGWGLNGWDISYIFQNGDNGGFLNQLGKQAWEVSNPAVMVNYASISRQIRRRDVKEAPETHLLNVHVPSLFEGKMSFMGQSKQQWDVKTFSTDKVPEAALAVTRVAVNFVNNYTETKTFDLSKYLDGNTVVSSTGQLRWTPATDGEKKGGYFTMNTAGTKAFVGFSPGGKTFDLGDGFKITPQKGFAVIYLTAKEMDANLSTCKEIIVTAMARARNTGMLLNTEENTIVEKGTAPILLEPVIAEVSIPFRGELQILDHDGNESKATRMVNQKFKIDGVKDQTPFYILKKN